MQVRIGTLAAITALVALGLWMARTSLPHAILFGVFLGSALAWRAVVTVRCRLRGREHSAAGLRAARRVYLATVGTLLFVGADVFLVVRALS
jgi:hypothetical protein